MSASSMVSVAAFEQNCLKFPSDMISVPVNTRGNLTVKHKLQNINKSYIATHINIQQDI